MVSLIYSTIITDIDTTIDIVIIIYWKSNKRTCITVQTVNEGLSMNKKIKTCLYRYKHTKRNNNYMYKLRENMGEGATIITERFGLLESVQASNNKAVTKDIRLPCG